MKIILTTACTLEKRSIGPSVLRYAPPLGLGYIAAVLEKNGHEVEIVDCLLLKYSVEEAADILSAKSPILSG